MSPSEIIGGVLAVLGAVVFAAAGIGLHRFPDTYMRISAVGTASGLGISLVTMGAALVHPRPGTVVVAVIAILFQLVTVAVATIMVARAAANSRHQFHPDTDTGVLEVQPLEDDQGPAADPDRRTDAEGRS